MPSYQVKRAIGSLLANLFIFIAYYLIISAREPSPSDYLAVFRFWGSTVLLFIPILGISKAIWSRMFNVIYRITTKEKEPAFADELDKKIYLRSIISFCQVFMIGFAVAMGVMAIGYPPTVMFKILLFSSIGGGVAIDITQLYYYHRGI